MGTRFFHAFCFTCFTFRHGCNGREDVDNSDALLGDCLSDEVLQSLAPDACQRAKETWLVGTKSGLMCVACNDAKLGGCWSKGTAGAEVEDFSRWRLTKHKIQITPCCRAVLFEGVSSEPLGAPPFSDFKQVLESVQKGSSRRANNEFKAWSDKTELMIWALQEALLNETRSELESATTISLTRDARRQRLFIRYGVAMMISNSLRECWVLLLMKVTGLETSCELRATS